MANMQNAAGSADQEMGIIQDSLEYKINALKQTWVGTLQEMTDRGTFGNIIDFLTQISEGLGTVVNDIGLLQTAFIGLGTYFGTTKLKLFGEGSIFGQFGNKADGGLFGSFKEFRQSRKDMKPLEEELSALKELKADLAKGEVKEDTLAGYLTGVENISDATKELITDSASVDTAIENVGDQLAETKAKGDGFTTMLKNIGGNLLNAFASFAISTAISLAITGIGKLITSYEDLAKETKEITDNYNDQKTQLNDYTSEINNLQEVLHNSASSTEEVKDATARLYEIQNDLISSYPAYAQQLDLVNGKLENQVGLLREIDKQNANSAINEINAQKSNKVKGLNLGATAMEAYGLGAAGLGGLYAQTAITYRTIDNVLNKEQNLIDAFKSAVFDQDLLGKDVGTKVAGSSINQIKDKYEDFNYELKTTDTTVLELAKHFDKAFEIEGDTIKTTGNIRDVNEAVLQLQTQLEAAGVTNEDVFNELNNIYSQTNDAIELYADAYDTETQKEILANKDLADSYYKLSDAYNSIIAAQQSGDTTKVKQLKEDYKDLFASIAEDSDLDERYLEYFKNMYPELQDLISNWEFEATVKPTLERNDFGVNDLIKNTSLDKLISGYYEFNANRDNKNYDEYTKNQFRKIEDIAADAGYSSAIAFLEAIKSTMKYADTGIDAFLQRLENNRDETGVSSQVLKARDEVAKSWYEALDESEQKFVDSLSSEDLAEAVKFSSTKQFDEWLKKCQEKAKIEVTTEFKESSAVDTMADMKTAVGSLSSLYDQIVTKTVTDGQATGFADPELINNVESAFYKFSEELKAEGNDAAANEINAALENFEKTLVEFPDDADKAQDAIDTLITKYIDQTDVIKNLTEENKDWSIAQLKAMNIENAEEVVQSRLNSNYKYNVAALRELTNEVENYNSVMAKGDETAKAKALGNLTDSVNKAIANYDSEGNITNDSFQVNDAFVKQHLADVQAMADGDEEALNRVRMAAARGAAMEVTTNVPTDVAEAQINNLMDMVAQADAMEIEPGASIEDSSFYDHLNQMLRSGQITVDQVNAAFATMGYEARWKSNRTRVRVPTGTHVTSIPTEAAKGMGLSDTTIRWDWADQTYDFPSLEIITKKGGTKASYHPSSGSTTGGTGGGNGGGNGDTSSSADNTEETFDWVEVAIQRVEQAINKLDEAVGNTYDKWSDRNKNLTDEIGKLKDELTIQKDAETIYKAKANAVGLTEKDARGNSYAEKIQNGEHIDIKSIETLGDETLIKKIQEYQQWWDKYIEARDAKQTIEIKLGEKYEQAFENKKAEYEEEISLVEELSGLIESRVSHVEEKGYFVSKKYYEQLKDYERTRLKDLKVEYKDLIKKRDEAVASGYIEKGSEAWNNMTKDILSVGKAIEEATTEVIKLNKEIRQINWDVFDFGQERIAQITQEAEFIIDLLDNQKLYDDTGNFNDRGWADMAMHASTYNVQMKKATDYGKERAKIEKQLAKDPANKDLIARREELLKLQQESIKAAYDEKEAVKDLVQEGKYLLSINLSNCWETLKTIRPQRRNEICSNVMV